ncbi:hypothetical protein [Novosphingobium sp. FKTRR1]|uniref:hypothetical protein n=1 Tax=Novosphingobium sp. FKTRR1 TaxID=2879118 RepID=UPI001CF0AF1D|nr:hypothetical protein [Novosphingobium sp. FKTRR1]
MSSANAGKITSSPQHKGGQTRPFGRTASCSSSDGPPLHIGNRGTRSGGVIANSYDFQRCRMVLFGFIRP